MRNRTIKFSGYDTTTNTFYNRVGLSLYGVTAYADNDDFPEQEIVCRGVDSFRLMQFVGEIEGVEIYEGFICNAKFRTAKGVQELSGTIVMDDFMWCLETSEDFYSINRLYDFEVIGNIHATSTT